MASGYCNGQRRCRLWIPLGIAYSVLDHSFTHPANICWLPTLHKVLVIRVQWRKAPLFCSSSWDGGSQREGHFSSIPLHTWLKEDMDEVQADPLCCRNGSHCSGMERLRIGSGVPGSPSTSGGFLVADNTIHSYWLRQSGDFTLKDEYWFGRLRNKIEVKFPATMP